MGNGIHTNMLLQEPGNEQVHTIAMGQRPESTKGVQLTSVKLELQKHDTVVFYILRDYRIVAPQDQAA